MTLVGHLINGRVITDGVRSQTGNTDITLRANLHFLAIQKKREYAEFSTSASPLRWQLVQEPLTIQADGTLRVPTAPGLGIVLNDDILTRYRVA